MKITDIISNAVGLFCVAQSRVNSKGLFAFQHLVVEEDLMYTKVYLGTRHTWLEPSGGQLDIVYGSPLVEILPKGKCVPSQLQMYIMFRSLKLLLTFLNISLKISSAYQATSPEHLYYYYSTN